MAARSRARPRRLGDEARETLSAPYGLPSVAADAARPDLEIQEVVVHGVSLRSWPQAASVAGARDNCGVEKERFRPRGETKPAAVGLGNSSVQTIA